MVKGAVAGEAGSVGEGEAELDQAPVLTHAEFGGALIVLTP